MADKSAGQRFPLPIYRRWTKMLRLPALLITIMGVVAWWVAPNQPLVAERGWLFLLLSAVGLIIFVYSVYAHRTSYVQCLPNYVLIRTPFLPVAVSYARIMQTHPTEFHSQFALSKLNTPRRRLLEPFLGRTLLLLELNSFPVSEKRLRTWLPWHMFSSDVTGFLLLVEDWMALSRQISAFRDRWISGRQAQERPIIGRVY